MLEHQGYEVGIFLNKGSISPSSNQFSFEVSDSIHSCFPTFKMAINDASGMYLDFTSFVQGVPITVKYGILDVADMLDINFRSSCRDTVSLSEGALGLNGLLNIEGIHESFFMNRGFCYESFKKVTVADAVTKLFNFEKKLFVENTIGNIEAYSNDDLYKFTKNILLPQATNGKIFPYYFFRNLLNELHFESLSLLENQSFSAKLVYGGEPDENNVYNVVHSFLPLNEKLEITLPNFNVTGSVLKDDLLFFGIQENIASDADCIIPVLCDTKIAHSDYYGRQFNPLVDYRHLNKAYCSNSMRSGFFVDKAIVTLSYYPLLVAGKTIDLVVSLYNEENSPEISETFSGIWLIEKSIHSWVGSRAEASTSLILCRSSMKPRSDSLLLDLSFKN